MRFVFGAGLFVSAISCFAACEKDEVAPAADAGVSAEAGTDCGVPALANGECPAEQRPNPLPGCPQDPGAPPTEVPASSRTDPAGSAETFTIEEALAGYPAATGVLTALITTEMGTIRCELDEAKAPVTVANFVGLARGTRPYRLGGKWRVGRFYDGLLWHRVAPGFVIQGGDPNGNGTGSAGYDIPLENQVDEPLGTLAMASAKVPSSSQFYIVVGEGPPAEYNVFGTCQTDVAVAISGVDAGPDEKPLVDVHMQRIDVARCPK